jgi:nucleoside-diphosphate-sugar epimerase
MKNILVMGAMGQIGSELTIELRNHYGVQNVVASDIKSDPDSDLNEGPFEIHDATDTKKTFEIVKKYNIDTIFNLPALLSATAEKFPQKAFELNLMGLYGTLEIARENKIALFTPSTIGAFGEGTPMDNTPQDTIMRPNSMYGVTKVSGELLCDYYHHKFGVDTRGIRYPGIISNKTLPGGGTTDYAVDIYYEAVKSEKYTSFVGKGTFLDMMYMPDAIKAAVDLMNADPSKLKHRNAFNVTAMSFDPEIQAESIRKHIPEFELNYDIDPVRQGLANSWPNSMDDSAAREEWNWKPSFDLTAMTEDMLKVLKTKYEKGQL